MVPPIVILRAVPQFAVVMFAVPLNDVPLIVLDVASPVAEEALPLSEAVIIFAAKFPKLSLFTTVFTVPVLTA